MLDLSENNIWDAWAEVISKIELKEWVSLDLNQNFIRDAWAKAIMKMELKKWVCLNLCKNYISGEMKDRLRKWVQWYKDRWIDCEVIVD